MNTWFVVAASAVKVRIDGVDSGDYSGKASHYSGKGSFFSGKQKRLQLPPGEWLV